MENETIERLRELLAISTGHNVEEILPQSQLAEDLGVNMEEDFPRLVKLINKEFEIDLKPHHVLHELEQAKDSVEQLAKLIDEEIELGWFCLWFFLSKAELASLRHTFFQEKIISKITENATKI